MKKYLAVFAVAVLGFTVSCSKGNPEAEAKAMLDSTIKITESTAEKLEKATVPKEAADAIISFASEMKVISEKGKELEKKYPDMNYRTDEKFNAENAAIKKAMKRFMEASMKASVKFSGSTEFAEATAKMKDILK